MLLSRLGRSEAGEGCTVCAPIARGLPHYLEVPRMTIRDYYDSYWSESGFNPRGHMKPFLLPLFRANIEPGWKCLDFGCGDGHTSGPWLVEHGCRYVGVDISETAVRAARQAGLEAQVIPDTSSLPFASGSFDAVLAVEVLEHLFDPRTAVLEMFRVLRGDGLLLATVPNVAYWRRRLDLALLGRWNPLGDDLSVREPWRDPHIRFFNAGALKRMLLSVGFSPVEVGGHEGSFIRDIPWVGPARWPREPSKRYQRAEKVLPSLLGNRLNAVAVKPRTVRNSSASQDS
jgi:SAM-dependent methyltransferase